MIPRILVIGGLCLAAVSPANALDGDKMRLPRAASVAINDVPAPLERDRGDHSFGWAEIQALRAFTRMQ